MPSPPNATANEVLLGPGLLYVAASTVTDPSTTAAVTGSSSWREIGWTEDGSSFDYELTTADIMVEEEFDPVKVATTGRKMSVTFQMAQSSRRNLALALNAGAAAANDSTLLEPPAPGSEVRVKLAFLSEEGALWTFRRVLQSGTVKVARKKSPNKATIPVTFKCERPSDGSEPFSVKPTSDGLI